MPRRGDLTRERLLDAAEMLVADHGFQDPSHRALAGHAGVHVALVNYHFGSKEMLFEEALARRSDRLVQAWRAALALVRAKPTFTAEEVLRAYWLPFEMIETSEDGSWRNYLCVVARLADATEGPGWYDRYFGVAMADFRDALRQSLPGSTDSHLDAGFGYARQIFDRSLLHRCGKTLSKCTPKGYRAEDVDRLIAFVGAGLRRLALNHVPQNFPRQTGVSA
jgi:AcrR family transcriptional regulator